MIKRDDQHPKLIECLVLPTARQAVSKGQKTNEMIQNNFGNAFVEF